MPSVCNFDPRPAVVLWINDKERRFRKTPKASQQEWFKNTFEVLDHYEQDEEEPIVQKTVIRKF